MTKEERKKKRIARRWNIRMWRRYHRRKARKWSKAKVKEELENEFGEQESIDWLGYLIDGIIKFVKK